MEGIGEEHECHVVLLAGPPASGKSTLGRAIESRLGYKHFDIGTHIRQNMPPDADLEDFAFSSVEHILRTETHVLLNGFPKYLGGLPLLTRRFHWVHLEFCLWLHVADVDVLVRRASARHSCGERPEDDKANFQTRLRIYEEETIPTISKLSCPVMKIDADMPKESVEASAMEAWKVAELQIGYKTRGSGSRERRDAEEADFEIVVCLSSGEERLRPLLPARAKVRTLRKMLVDDGETEFDLKLYLGDREVLDNEIFCYMDGFTVGCTIVMVRHEKPPPSRPSPTQSHRERDDYPICFTGDSLACIFDSRSGKDMLIEFSKVKVGDLIRSAPGKGKDSYCRVRRVWAHHWAKKVQIFEVAAGCRLTPGHPVLHNGRWRKSEDCCRGEWRVEEFVYQLEAEGHVDIALVGGVQCALLGCYCGSDFGWNVFTRKTVKCSSPCQKCDKAYMPGLDFSPSNLPKHMLPPTSFEPY